MIPPPQKRTKRQSNGLPFVFVLRLTLVNVALIIFRWMRLLVAQLQGLTYSVSPARNGTPKERSGRQSTTTLYEAEIDSRFELVCLDGSGCGAPFEESEIRRFLDDKAFKLLDKLRTANVLKEVPHTLYPSVLRVGGYRRSSALSFLFLRRHNGGSN